MNRHRWIQGLVAALVFVAIAGSAHATFSVVADRYLQFLGQWYWNSATSSLVLTRVKNLSCSTVVVLVDVKARALDGSTVGASTRIQLGPLSGREVSQVLSKPITPLQFVQLRANGQLPTACNGNHEPPGRG